ncbi:coiled-coil domain-containing protein 170-like isoform X1 [Uranotaenia lowii]|uniref:coiled-coil domain-containing protein 170-like isoform X1 n=2 Tax=Uranotaenia lowii TaxID=190385 RepID=UPI00247979CE|nr:coiled-coil domain-containing protein 170-like isoform X1 [Uranotaenia lowii]XP_055599450.1 coiled-coil domain-containing protein 170-like isoform X1 [Uranotaenia lowii]
MSKRKPDEEGSGNSEQDWEIFDILCGGEEIMPKHHHSPVHHHHHPEPSCNDHHLSHSIDLVTTLRSELAASTYKRDRLMAELSDAKSSLCAKENECEALRAQSARQTSLITSLQQRLAVSENREKTLHARSENVVGTLNRDKKHLEEKIKELCEKLRRLGCELTKEEGHRDQARAHLHDLVRRLCLCLGVDVCDSTHLTPECVLAKAGETVAELHRLRSKLSGTCEHLSSTEAELITTKSTASAEKTRLQTQIDGLQSLAQGLEGRCRQAERDLQTARDRLAESEVCGDKLREELRGFESRCCRLQNNLDRFQTDRLQFLRTMASIVGVQEPCKNNIRDKLRDLMNHNQSLHDQLTQLKEQLHQEASRHREHEESTNCRLKSEEQHRTGVEERLEKACHELQHFRAEHTTLSEYLVRLARALCWSECSEPPAPGSDTTIMSETLLERAERLATHHDHHHVHGVCDKTERDEAMHRAKRTSKSAERTAHQLADVKAQLCEVKGQLQEASDYKITALERGRKCDELQSRLCELEGERERLVSQLAAYKNRARSAAENSHERSHTITHLRDELSRIKTELSDTNHRLSQVQAFRSSVAKLLHLRDCADSELLHKLQSIASAHHRCTCLGNSSSAGRRYGSSSPLAGSDHHCSRYDDLGPPGNSSSGCRPLSSSPVHTRRYIDSGFNDHDHHFDDDFDFGKKY